MANRSRAWWGWALTVGMTPWLAGMDCNYSPADKDGDTGGGTIVTDSGNVSCVGDASNFALGQYDEISAVCVSGTSSFGYPPNFGEQVPSSSGVYAGTVSEVSWDSGTGEFLLEVVNSSGALVNDYGNDGTIWEWTYDAACNDYPITGHDFYYIDGVYYGWMVPAAPDCPVVVQPMPIAPPGRVPTGPQACVAGQADFDLAVRRAVATDGSEASLWVVPLATTEIGFPERAWLRQLEVLEWGDADNLHVWPTIARPQTSGMNLVGGGIRAQKPASGPTTLTFAAGAQSMSSVMGIERLDLTGVTRQLPKVRLTWSCESDAQNPHGIPITGFTGYAATMPEISPIQHRLVFWGATDGTKVRIAPEGRYLDYVEADLTPSGQGGSTFIAPLSAYEATLAGRIRVINGQVWLLDLVATVGTQTVQLQNRVLAPL